MTTTSHPSTSTEITEDFERGMIRSNTFTTELVHITAGRGNSLVRPIKSVLPQKANGTEGQGGLELGGEGKNTI